ncbi:unnamed protein product [Schistosoma margrebowiei]|uniref:Phosphatidylinositol transfer protein N-terminal domain-containing protein n=1 Tax=Schistosoma margrebowiei TaxID=48269 RepID=A0A183LKA4_9TREM|nr:unnamed protein product [Schistosoma margrebowiei]
MEAGDQQLVHSPFVPAGYWSPCAPLKKSREESTGRGSGVEILKNEPYENGPGGKGQYTFKIYHVGSHLPSKSYVSKFFGPKLLAFFTGHLLNTNLTYFTYYLRCIQAISEI